MVNKIEKELQETKLWTRSSLLLTFTLLFSLFIGQGWLQPVEADAAVTDLMHNSAKVGTKYGTWGAGFTCATCHNAATTNIKLVAPSITPPWALTARSVKFDKITSTTINYLGVMGNDQRQNLNTSTNVCEVCHTKTRYHQYSSSSVTHPQFNTTHNNRKDCTQSCHPHNAGFAASVTGCTGCHGNPPSTTLELVTTAFSYALVPGAHAKHTTLYAPAIACITCHQGTNITMTSGDNKVNLGFQINKANWPQYSPPGNSTAASAVVVNSNYAGWQVAAPTTSSTAANTMTCSVYCHGGWNYSGGGGVQSATGTVVSWATSGYTYPTDCNKCHYNSPTEVNTAGASAPGSHFKHAGAVPQQAYACAACHGAAPTTTAHVNGDTKVTFALGGKYKGNVNYTSASAKSSGAAYGSCTTTACHGQNSPAAWGTAVTPVSGNVCQKCHGSLSAPLDTTFGAYSSPRVAPGYGADGRDTGGHILATDPRVGTHQAHLTAADGISDTIHCGECHTTHLTVQEGTHLNYSTSTITFGPLAKKGHSPTVSRTSGIISCNTTYCHTGTYNTGSNMTPAWNDTSYIPTTTLSTLVDVVTCSKCHGMPPSPGTGNHASISATIPGFPTTSCNCHPNLSPTGTNYGNIFVDKKLHINGTIEANSSCTDCHATAQGNRAAIVGQFSMQSHHVQGRALSNADCYQCHMEALDATGKKDPAYHVGVANSNAAVNLTKWVNGARTTAGYISYTANGKRTSIAKLNSHCLGCHNTASANLAIQPLGTYNTDQYSWEAKIGKAKSSIQSRYSSTTVVPWSQFGYTSASQFGTNRKKGVAKALSAHGNASKNSMPAWSNALNGPGEDSVMPDYTNKNSNRNVFCYDCHNSHGSNASGITSSYSSATGKYKGGLLKTTTANIGGYNATYTPVVSTVSYKNYSGRGLTTATFNPGANICNDCHNDNTTAYKNVVVNKPWNIFTTYSSTKAIGGYWSTPYFGNYTFASAERSVYKAGGATGTNKDYRKPMGGHFGSSIFNNNSGAKNASGIINGLCTPCHDPHGVSSSALGASRDHGVPLLKGTWVTSPYKEDKADIIVARGGGRNFPFIASGGAIPGYHIDQNTLVNQPVAVNGGAALSTLQNDKRGQLFASLATKANTIQTAVVADFAGLCTQCHSQASLTGNAARTTPAPWKTKSRVHQSVSGWAPISSASNNSRNKNNNLHAYTCSKCHAPHVSRLPRLLVTNCLDVSHKGKVVSGGSVSSTQGVATANQGNLRQTVVQASSGNGMGRFPGGGARYTGNASSAQNPGGWWFQAANSNNSTTAYGSACHNQPTAGGATFIPTNQRWNKKSDW